MRILASLLLPLIFTIHSASAQVATVAPDGLGGYWQIKGTKVARMDATANTLSSYSNIKLGHPHSVDASDPFRVIVLYLSLIHISEPTRPY